MSIFAHPVATILPSILVLGKVVYTTYFYNQK